MKYLLLPYIFILATGQLFATETSSSDNEFLQVISKIDSLIEIKELAKADSLITITWRNRKPDLKRDSMAYAKFLAIRGYAMVARKQWDIAYQYYQKAYVEFQLIQDTFELAMVLRYLAIIKANQGEFAMQRVHIRRSADFFKQIDSTYDYATSLITLANAWRSLGDDSSARDIFEEARDSFVAIGGPTLKLASINYNLADLYYKRNKLGYARSSINEALIAFIAEKDEARLAKAYNLLGVIEHEEKQYVKADANYQLSLHYAQIKKDSLLLFDALLNLSSNEIARFNRKKAKAYYAKAKVISPNPTGVLERNYLDLIGKSIAAIDEEYETSVFQLIASLFISFSLLLLGVIYGIRQKNRRRRERHIHEKEHKKWQHEKELLEIGKKAAELEKQNLVNQRKAATLEKLLRRNQEESIIAQAKVQEETTKKLSDLVHNTVANELIAVQLKLLGVKDMLVADGLENVISDEINEIIEMVTIIKQDARRIETSVKWEGINWLQLLDEVFNRIDGISEKLTIKYRKDGLKNGLPKDMPGLDADLYKIISNCAFNSIQYANPRQITCLIHLMKEELNIIIVDDGSGFDTSKTTYGSGLRQLSEITEKWGGKVDITSNEKGTTITITIPIAQKN